jgi:hypothetical protein
MLDSRVGKINAGGFLLGLLGNDVSRSQKSLHAFPEKLDMIPILYNSQLTSKSLLFNHSRLSRKAS